MTTSTNSNAAAVFFRSPDQLELALQKQRKKQQQQQQQQIGLILDPNNKNSAQQQQLVEGYCRVFRKFKFASQPISLGIKGTTTTGTTARTTPKNQQRQQLQQQQQQQDHLFRYSVYDHDQSWDSSSSSSVLINNKESGGDSNNNNNNNNNDNDNDLDDHHVQQQLQHLQQYHHYLLMKELFQGIGKLRGLQKLEFRKIQLDLNHLTQLLQQYPPLLESLKMEDVNFTTTAYKKEEEEEEEEEDDDNDDNNNQEDTVVQQFLLALQNLPNLRRIQLWIPPLLDRLVLIPSSSTNSEGAGGEGMTSSKEDFPPLLSLRSKVALGLVTQLASTKSNCMISVGPEVYKPRPNNVWDALERTRNGVDLYVNDLQLGTAALLADSTTRSTARDDGLGREQGHGLDLLYVCIGPSVAGTSTANNWKKNGGGGGGGIVSSFCQALVQNTTLETLVLCVKPASAWALIEEVVSILPKVTYLQSLVIRCSPPPVPPSSSTSSSSSSSKASKQMKKMFHKLDQALEINYSLRDVSVYDLSKAKDNRNQQLYHSSKKDLYLRLNYPYGSVVAPSGCPSAAGGGAYYYLASRNEMLLLSSSSSSQKRKENSRRSSSSTGHADLPIHRGMPPTTTTTREKWLHQFVALNREEDIDGLFYYTYQYMTLVMGTTTTTTATETATTEEEEEEEAASAADSKTTATTANCVDSDDSREEETTATSTSTTMTRFVPNSPNQLVNENDEGTLSEPPPPTTTTTTTTTDNGDCDDYSRNETATSNTISAETTTTKCMLKPPPFAPSPVQVVHKSETETDDNHSSSSMASHHDKTNQKTTGNEISYMKVGAALVAAVGLFAAVATSKRRGQ